MLKLNPWVILGVMLALLVMVGVVYTQGHSDGVDDQKLADQAEFDHINAELTKQKAEANALWQEKATANAERATEVGKLTHQLGVQHEENRQLTDRNRLALDALRLRWKSAESSGRGDSAGDTKANHGGAASSTEAAICEFPEALDRSLKEILADADRLRDDYEYQYNERRSVVCH